MTDDQANTGQNPPAQPGGKNPLDVLEEILNQSKKEDTAQQAEAQQAAAEQAEMAQAQQEMAAQRREDQAKIQQQLEQLKTIEDTPQYQARVEQEAAKVQEKQDSENGTKGNEIRQIQHTKI